jgi:capsular polysaccharide biosynthesis protein
MLKNVTRILSVVALLSLVLAACAPAATPKATAAPVTAAPVTAAPATVAPATVAATTAPVATQGAAPAAGTNWCSGTKIVFFPGGTAGGGFEQVVYNGAVQAAADTGADVQYVWSDWDPAKMITQFTQAAATKPNGIAVMGHPGDTAFDPLIDDAESQGIIVTSMNTQLPLAQAKYGAKGFGYAGALLYSAGYSLGTEAVAESVSPTCVPRAIGCSLCARR